MDYDLETGWAEAEQASQAAEILQDPTLTPEEKISRLQALRATIVNTA